MSASASVITISPDGKTVSMPVETFRAREADLLRYEQLVPTLKAQLESERAQFEKLQNAVMVLESRIKSERASAEAVFVSLRADRRKYGLLGFVIGGIAVGLTK